MPGRPIRTALGSALVLLALLGGRAPAGPNAGGTLIFHDSPVPNPTCDWIDYCGRSGLTSCAEAVPQSEEFYCLGFHLLAAFPEGGTPRLSSVAFALDYDPERVILFDYGSCTDGPDAMDPGWPDPGTGYVAVWPSPASGTLVEVGFIMAYEYYSYGPSSVGLLPHPTLGAVFRDDSNPPVEDAIMGFGTFGILQPGFAPCPEVTPVEETTWGRIKTGRP